MHSSDIDCYFAASVCFLRQRGADAYYIIHMMFKAFVGPSQDFCVFLV